MTNVEKLRAWAKEEEKKGLVDIKYDLGPRAIEMSLEDLCGVVLNALQSENTIDITEDPL